MGRNCVKAMAQPSPTKPSSPSKACRMLRFFCSIWHKIAGDSRRRLSLRNFFFRGKLDPVASFVLGFVERAIGTCNQFVQIRRLPTIETGRPNTGGYVIAVISKDKFLFFKLLANTLEGD